MVNATLILAPLSLFPPSMTAVLGNHQAFGKTDIIVHFDLVKLTEKKKKPTYIFVSMNRGKLTKF